MKDIKYTDYYRLELLAQDERINKVHQSIPKELIDPVLYLLVEAINTLMADEEFQGAIQVNEVAKEIDLLLNKQYQNEGLVNERNKEHATETPLTLVLNKILNRLFKDDRMNDLDLHIYSVLEDWILSGVGERIAIDKRFQTYQDWIKLYYKTETLYSFHSGWLNTIPVASLSNQLSAIISIPSTRQVFEKSRRFDDSKYDWYRSQMEDLKNKSCWEFVSETTRSSDQFYLDFELSFRKRLLRKLGPKILLDWIDKLELPIFQDNVFIDILELEEYPILISTIISNEFDPKTNKHIFLLMTLRNAFRAAKRVSQTLERYTEERLNKEYNISDVGKSIYEEGIIEFQNWQNIGVKNYLIEVMDAIFPDKRSIVQNEYFKDVNDWVASRVARDSDFTTIALKEIFDSYLSKVDLPDYLSQLTEEGIHWGILMQIVSLVGKQKKVREEDRDKILGFYKSFLKSEGFYWDLEIKKDNIEKFRSFMTILSLYPDPFLVYKEIYQEYESYAEGWKIERDQKNFYKENFLLCAGSTILEFVAEGRIKKSLQSKWYDFIISTLLEKHRFNLYSRNYLAPLIFLGYMVRAYSPKLTEQFIKAIINNIDEIDQAIFIISSVNLNQVSGGIKQSFVNRVNTELPIEKEKLLMRKQNRELASLMKAVEDQGINI